MPEPSINSPNPLLHEQSLPIASSVDFERVLHVLDFEIERIQAEQRRPGWSIWAIYGALGTSIWLLSEQIASGNASLINVLQLLIAFSAMGYLLDVIAMAAPIQTTEATYEGRFRWFSDSANRRVVLVETFRLVATTLLILLVTAGISWPELVTALVVFGAMALLNSAVLVATFLKFPVMARSIPIVGIYGRVIGTSIWSIELLIFGWITYAYLKAASTSAYSLRLADVRIAILISASVFILKLLADESLTSPLLVSLIETRRELVFGNIDLTTAIVKAEIAIAGMNEADIFQEDVRGILHVLDQLDRVVLNATRFLENLKATTPSPIMNAENSAGAKGILDHGDEVINTANDLHRELDKRIRNLRRRLWFVGSASAQITDVQNRISNARMQSGIRAAYLSTELQSFRDNHTLTAH